MNRWNWQVLAVRTVIGLACIVTPSIAFALESDKLYAMVSGSVVIVVGIDASNEMISQGSGIVIAPGEIVTNCHVLDGMLSLAVKQGDRVSSARIRFVDRERDLCQLTLDGKAKIGRPIAGIVSYSDLRVGQRVYAVGAPQGLELTISDGLIAQLRRAKEADFIQTTAPVSPGSSGGGLFDANGKLVGITTFILEGQNLNFAIPANWILELPSRHAQQKPSATERITEAERRKRAIQSQEEPDPTPKSIANAPSNETRQIGITVLPFAGEERFTQPMGRIISADLQRSGVFKLGSIGSVRPLPVEPSEINYRYWKNEGTDMMVIGSVSERTDGHVEVRFRLMDIAKESQTLGFSYTVTVPQLRATAHKIADLIYEKLTGDAGVFATKICYVTKSEKRFELQVADADGFNADFILAHREPITSPQWSPDGTRIAYVSYERKKAIIFLHNLLDGTRFVLANYEGENLDPAWSPDGKKLAIVLTKDGTPNLYVIGADGSGLNRLTSNPSTNVEPNYSPDGDYMLFTSDRGGGRQIYRMRADGQGEAERMTFEGSYNVTPRYSPDGKSFIFIHGNEGRFNVAVQDIASRQMQILTAGSRDQSPNYAPNGKMILYASEIKGRGILAIVSSDGRIKQRITAQSGEISEPAWGPLPSNRRKE